MFRRPYRADSRHIKRLVRAIRVRVRVRVQGSGFRVRIRVSVRVRVVLGVWG